MAYTRACSYSTTGCQRNCGAFLVCAYIRDALNARTTPLPPKIVHETNPSQSAASSEGGGDV